MLVLLNGGGRSQVKAKRAESCHSLMLVLLNGGYSTSAPITMLAMPLADAVEGHPGREKNQE